MFFLTFHYNFLGVISHGTANLAANIQGLSSSKNYCGTTVSPASAKVSPGSAVTSPHLTHVLAKPSPTLSLQVTMKDFDLLKVLGTGGKLVYVYGTIVGYTRSQCCCLVNVILLLIKVFCPIYSIWQGISSSQTNWG